MNEIALSKYPGFVRGISLSIGSSILVRVEFTIEFSNEVGYIYEKEFRDMDAVNAFLQKELKEVRSVNKKEMALKVSHLNLLRDLIKGNIKYLEGFSSNTSIKELEENYAYIASDQS